MWGNRSLVYKRETVQLGALNLDNTISLQKKANIAIKVESSRRKTHIDTTLQKVIIFYSK